MSAYPPCANLLLFFSSGARIKGATTSTLPSFTGKKKDFGLPASDEESRDEKILETKYCAPLAAA